MVIAVNSNSQTLTTPALQCHQQGYSFFAFILTAEQLAEISYTLTGGSSKNCCNFP
jgi:hypothetical protein